MDAFDNAIHYGPNDAGVSALTITLVIFAILAISWLLGAAYGSISNLLNNSKNKDDNE